MTENILSAAKKVAFRSSGASRSPEGRSVDGARTDGLAIYTPTRRLNRKTVLSQNSLPGTETGTRAATPITKCTQAASQQLHSNAIQSTSSVVTAFQTPRRIVSFSWLRSPSPIPCSHLVTNPSCSAIFLLFLPFSLFSFSSIAIQPLPFTPTVPLVAVPCCRRHLSASLHPPLPQLLAKNPIFNRQLVAPVLVEQTKTNRPGLAA